MVGRITIYIIRKGTLAVSVFFLGLFSMIAAFNFLESLPHSQYNPNWITVPMQDFSGYFALGFVALGGLSVAIGVKRLVPAGLFTSIFVATFWYDFIVNASNVHVAYDFSVVSGMPGLVENVQAFYFFVIAMLLFLISQILAGHRLTSVSRTTVFGAGVLWVFSGLLVAFTPYGAIPVTRFQGAALSFISNDFLFYLSSAILVVYGITNIKARIRR